MKKIAGVIRDKHGRIMVYHRCEICGKKRKILKTYYERGMYKLCMKCASKKRDREYMEIHGHGKNYRGSKYFTKVFINCWENGAKVRNLEWLLSFDDLDALWEKQENKCAFTGKLMCLKPGFDTRVSLDRIDSTKGYRLSNVQFVCSYINFAKQNRTDDQFIKMCAEIVNYRLKDVSDSTV